MQAQTKTKLHTKKALLEHRHKPNQKNKMARSNPNASAGGSQSKQFSLLETGTRKPEAEMEPNPLAIINALLALKNPEDLFEWLDLEHHNLAKLIKFIIAVCDNYDKLAADCTTAEANWDSAQEEILTQKEALAKKQAVIQYLQGQLTDINAENKFWALRQDSKNFNIFWAEFQQLSIELDRSKATLISDLTSKLSYDMRWKLSSGDKRPIDLLKYAEHCQCVYQDFKDLARMKAALD